MVATIPNNLLKDTGNKTISFEAIHTLKTRPDNTIIVHQSKMYSRDEVETLCMRAYHQATKDAKDAWLGTFDKWIQDNL